MRAVADILDALRERDLLQVAESIAKAYRVTVADMLSASRCRDHSHARQALWSELAGEYNFSTPRIGELVGRNHSTISVGIAKHRARVDRTEDEGTSFADALIGLEARIDDLERETTRLRAELDGMTGVGPASVLKKAVGQ